MILIALIVTIALLVLHIILFPKTKGVLRPLDLPVNNNNK